MKNSQKTNTMSEVNLYIIFGALTTLINFIVYEVFIYFNFEYKLSNTIAFIFSIIFAYVTNKIYVFRSTCENIQTLLREIFSFLISRLFTYGLEMILLILLINFFNINKSISKIIVTIIVVILNYILSKTSVFNKGKQEA